MSRAHALGPLVDLLVDLYPTEEGSRRVVAEAGLHHGPIPFQDAAIDNWFAILQEADRRDAVATVVAVAQEEYPGSAEQLSAALEAYESARDEPVDAPASGPYRLNLTMLMVMTVVLPVWFYLHIYPLVQKSLAVGALGAGLAAGLVAAWKFANTFVGKELSKAGRSRFDRLMRSPATSRLLGLLTLGALALALCTTSVYLVHDPGRSEELVVALHQAPDGSSSDSRPFEPRPKLRTNQSIPLDGGPIFFRPPGETVELSVEGSPILEVEPAQQQLWPWKRLEIKHIRPRKLSAFRLALGSRVMGRLAAPGDTAFRVYALEVLWDGEPAGRIDDVRQGLIYFGADSSTIDVLRLGESLDQKKQRLGECAGSGSVDELMEYWEAGLQVLEAARPPGARELEIRLFPQPATAEDLNPQAGMVKSTVDVSAEAFTEPGLHTVCM